MTENRALVRLRLTRKFASVIDGIDLSCFLVGQEIRLSRRNAFLLVAEGWAVAVIGRGNGKLTGNGKRKFTANGNERAVAADRAPKRRHRQVRGRKTGRP